MAEKEGRQPEGRKEPTEEEFVLGCLYVPKKMWYYCGVY